jgi:hypothetical protein
MLCNCKSCPITKETHPVKSARASESAHSLSSNAELAKELLQAVSDFEERLKQLRDKSEKAEPADEHKKFTKAWATVAWELGVNFLYPVYQRHKGLDP